MLFIRALATLLRFGLTVAEESITFTGKSSGKGENSGSSSGSGDFEKELNKYISKADATTSAGWLSIVLLIMHQFFIFTFFLLSSLWYESC